MVDALGVGCLDGLGFLERNRSVDLAPLEHDRALGLFVDQGRDRATVVRHRAGDARQAAGSHPGDYAAPAVANDAGLASGFAVFERCCDFLERVIEIDLLHDLDAGSDVGLRVAGFILALDAVEERRCDREVAVGGKAVGDAADVFVRAEDLRGHDDQAARLAGGLCDVCVKLVSVRCFQLNSLAHVIGPR